MRSDFPERAALRVLLLTPWFPNVPGDREGNFIHDSAAALARAQAVVAVLVARPWLRAKLGQEQYRSLGGTFDATTFKRFESVELVHYPAVPGSRLPRLSAWLHDRTVGAALSSLARSFKPDVVHAHTEGAAPVAVAVGRKLGLPVVVTLHGVNTAPRYFGAPFRRGRIRAALAAADRVVLVGRPLEKFFGDLIGDTRNFQVVPNGFDPPAARPRMPIGSARALRCISVANLHDGKGIDLVLQALARMRGQGREDFTYTIVGDGYGRGGLTALAAGLGLADKVRFTGACAHDKVYSYLHEGDVFVLPSLREAFGVAYLEAMAAGLLAIGVEGQGPAAFIRAGETGLLVPPRNAGHLAACLTALADDRPRMRAIAAAGQAYVMDHLTWDHHARKLVQVYRDVARLRAAAPV